MVMAPMRAGKKWASNFIPTIIIILSIPLIFMWFVVPCKSYVTVQEGGGLIIDYEKMFEPFSASAHSSFAAIIFGCATFLCNVLILVKLLKNNIKRLEKAERTLVIFGILLMVTTMMYAITQALLFAAKHLFQDSSMQKAVYNVRPFIIDIFILPNAWTLPLLSRSVRNFYSMTLKRMISTSTQTFTSIAVPQISKQRHFSCGNIRYRN
ncbi:hypothetical protein ANCCEY_07490 [Ancylostoma ceylanicum]|uniref:Serpentine receptor class gamma n=1 Tax=Ancylostoma ceylanicum TaxID=53326 RepID=A0A0D6LNK0_9BILA|nr:hypothetical protein ANCCEY_07490 [Ancylostoma ceylanicum]